MAGRGTDITLGDGVADLGGLFVIGTERHESRRVDRQLRGRCSRQGDPGMSKFFVSLEDDLMRIFASSGMIARFLQKNFKEGDVLSHPLLNRSIETAQKKVEQYYYSVRKRLLQYDDVLNKQREVIYSLRNDALDENNARNVIFEIISNEIDLRIEKILRSKKDKIDPENVGELISWINVNFPIGINADDLAGKVASDAKDMIFSKIKSAYEIKESSDDPDSLRRIERFILVQAIDNNWQNHLTEMDALRNSVGLRSYGQRDPINEYRTEAFEYFDAMLQQVNLDICAKIFRVAGSAEAFKKMFRTINRDVMLHGAGLGEPADNNSQNGTKQSPKITVRNVGQKINRNDLCPCGSGKKYKKCCGAK
jgi:preprotein translocase subunit SecA